jgi:hypothetical protein
MSCLQDVQAIHQLIEISIEVENFNEGTNKLGVILEKFNACLIVSNHLLQNLLDS